VSWYIIICQKPKIVNIYYFYGNEKFVKIGYLKNEKNEETAECFLKSSPCLSECYQMFKNNRNFNIKVNGFSLQNIFEVFGTMCSMSKFCTYAN